MSEISLREVLNPSRLAALRRTGLLDTPAEAAFDRLSRMASRILDAPIVLISLIDATRQFFKSCQGLPEPWVSLRESPLPHSFCQHVLGSTAPLVIEDARVHPVFRESLAAQQLSVVAYLGIPLVLSDGHVLGSFCAIDTRPRAWTADEIETLSVLAHAAMTEIELRMEVDRTAEANRQLASANEELRAFTYSVAHDLGSHLGRLRCFTDILIEESGQATADCQSYMQTIQRTGHQITTLLDALLNLAKATTLELRTDLVDMTALAEEVAIELRHADPQRATEIAVQENLVTRADPALARLLLQNLVGNAWKFTAKRRDARIEVSATEWRGTLRFAVSDNGVGFRPEQAEQLFQPFSRLHNASEFPGSGLGLQGAKRIVERHGGTIYAEGKVGEGACFYFTLERPLLAQSTEAEGGEAVLSRAYCAGNGSL